MPALMMVWKIENTDTEVTGWLLCISYFYGRILSLGAHWDYRHVSLTIIQEFESPTGSFSNQGK